MSLEDVPPEFDSTHLSSDAAPIVRSFNVTASFSEPQAPPAATEPQVIPVLPMDIDIGEDDTRYEEIDSGTQRGGVMLADSLGYTYTRKRTTTSKVTWRCSVRSKAYICKVGVNQVGQQYTRTPYGHDHPAQPGIAERIRMTKNIHKKAKENIFTSAAALVEDVMLTDVDLDAPADTRPVPTNVTRSANYPYSPH